MIAAAICSSPLIAVTLKWEKSLMWVSFIDRINKVNDKEALSSENPQKEC